jgi:hypothetical protein
VKPVEAVMRERMALLRIGGAFYALVIVLGLSGEMVVRARVTPQNIHAMETLWRVGIASEFFLLACSVIVALIVFVLLRPVNADLALLAIFFNLVSIAVEAAADLNLINALSPLGNPALSMHAHGQGFGVALIFFGFFCVIAGYLLYVSGYCPRAIGVLMQIAGFCYLANSFALLLAPAVARRIFPLILVPAFIGESSFALWLLFGRAPPMAARGGRLR